MKQLVSLVCTLFSPKAEIIYIYQIKPLPPSTQMFHNFVKYFGLFLSSKFLTFQNHQIFGGKSFTYLYLFRVGPSLPVLLYADITTTGHAGTSIRP
jgi:hypothetical protein